MNDVVIRWIPADELSVDPDVQRNLDRSRVDKIAKEFRDDAVGVLTVSERGGALRVVDGQHRRAAAQAVRGESVSLECRVFTGLTLAQEAELFRLLNNTAKPSHLDLFKIRVIEGDEVAQHINKMVEDLGWRVELQHAVGSFAATAAAERVYALAPEAVYLSLEVISKAWGVVIADGRVFEGIGKVFARYGDVVSSDDLASRLMRHTESQEAVLAKAKTLASLIRTTASNAVAEIVVEAYNKGRKSRQLPAWRQ